MGFRPRNRSWLNSGLCFAGIGGAAAAALLALYVAGRPAGPLSAAGGYSRIVYDRHGKVLRVTLSGDEKYRVYAHLNAVSPLLKEALLLKEDKYFYFHPGFNPVSLIRAVYQTAVKGRKMGGSTITMQVARLYYKLKTRTVAGKMRQILSALYLELYYTKNEILQAYLNLAPCGGNIEGFAAGSLILFGKSLPDLTLEEALFLSVLPQNPSACRPRSRMAGKELAGARRLLFESWKKEHPDAGETSAHMALPLEVRYQVPFHAPHYTDALLATCRSAHTIHGTLDLPLQRMITRLTRRYLQRRKTEGVYNAAVLLVDSRNMQILASLGSADYFDDGIHGQVNGTRSRRSPGSTLKPFIYALAMDQGLIHPRTMLKDAPVSFSEYAPDNYEKDFRGPITAAEALMSSRNVPAVTLASKIKEPDLYGLLARTGAGDLKPREHYGLSIVLGSAEFTMQELVALYGILVNNGTYRPLVDSYESEAEKPPVYGLISPEACYLVLNILEKNPRPSSLPIPLQTSCRRAVAYKTGTSIGFKDCWSIAVFDHYLLAVWMGNFNGYGNPAFNGRLLATPLLFEIVDAIQPDPNSVPRQRPETVTEVEVCAVSGQLAREHCRSKIASLYIPGVSSIEKCGICREIYVNTRTGYRTFERRGEHIEKRVCEFWTTDLLDLFRRAGIPRRTPPPFDPRENFDLVSRSGTAPEIISPLRNTEYIVQQGKSSYNRLPLKANVDADIREVYWFIGSQFVGRSGPEETQYWSLKPGSFNVGVVDDHGRSDYREIRIVMAGN